MMATTLACELSSTYLKLVATLYEMESNAKARCIGKFSFTLGIHTVVAYQGLISPGK